MSTAPINNLTSKQCRVVEEAIRNPPSKLFGPARRWDFVLLLMGERPACRLRSSRELASHRAVTELRTRPEEFARGEFLGQLLHECGLPFLLRFSHSETSDSSSLPAAYYVTVDADRFEQLPDPVSTSPTERPDNWASHPRAVGQFLGYPADAIDAHEANACSANGEWIEVVPEWKIEDRVRPLLDRLSYEPSVSITAILDAVLPYTPPLPSFSTSSEHFERAVRYLRAGVRAEQYGIRALVYHLDPHYRTQ